MAERTIVINDGNGVIDENISTLSTYIGGFVATNLASNLVAKTTFIAGDGQPFTDTISFMGGNGTFIADDTLDGSGGEFWDTDTYDVSSFIALGDTSASATVSRGTDCLNWVAQVFSVTAGELPLRQEAAELAKLLIDGPYLGDGDTWGGKGWDSLQSKYVTPQEVKTDKYSYWNNKLRKVEFDAGVDCSGLVMWAYNRSFDPEKYFPQNVICFENSDGQHRNNSETINENELRSGDILFMDKDNNDRADHVAMYVGNNNIVDAFSRDRGIISTTLSELRTRQGFINLDASGIRRVVLSPSLGGSVQASSPIDLIVFDPDGFIITPASVIQTEDEFLREVPGELYYAEGQLGSDGRPNDIVYWPTQKTGDYLFSVTAEPDALPTDTYDLIFTSGEGTTTVLAENIPISDIPDRPYIVRATREGVEKIVPAKVNLTPKMLNLANRGVFSAIIEISKGFGVSVADIDTETINVNSAFPVNITVAAGKFLVAIFRTQDLQNVQSGNEVKLRLSGNLNDGTKFEGADAIRIINQGRFLSLSQFNQLASVLTSLQSSLSILLELLRL